MENKITSNVIKGLIISLIVIVISLIFYFVGLTFEEWSQYVIYAVFAGGIVWSCIIYGKEMENTASFGNIFAHGFKVSAVVAVLMVAYILLFSFIFPEMKEQTLVFMQEKMAENPKVTQEIIDQTVDMYTQWFTPIMIAGTLFGYMFSGLLASLLGAALTRKRPSTIQQQP